MFGPIRSDLYESANDNDGKGLSAGHLLVFGRLITPVALHKALDGG